MPNNASEKFILDLFRAEGQALTGQLNLIDCVAPVLARWGAVDALEAFKGLWHQIEVDYSVLELVQDFRTAGIFCGVASNQQALRAQKMSLDLGYRELFDAEFYSCHLGVRKPDLAYFRIVLRQIGFQASRTVFIDDRMENIDAAQKIGLRAIHFSAANLTEGGEKLRRLLT